MVQYVDKAALVAEIEMLDALYHTSKDLSGDLFIKGLFCFLDTLEVKEMNLDDFIKEEFNKYSCVDGYGQLSVSYNMAEFYGMIKRLTKAQKGE